MEKKLKAITPIIGFKILTSSSLRIRIEQDRCRYRLTTLSSWYEEEFRRSFISAHYLLGIRRAKSSLTSMIGSYHCEGLRGDCVRYCGILALFDSSNAHHHLS
jgi:hypothetical protein